MRTVRGIVLALATSILGLGESARANFIVNPGLTPNVKANRWGMVSRAAKGTKQPLNGWTVAGAIDVVPSKYWQTTGSSGYSVDLIGTPGLGSIRQTITGLTAGQQYVLTFDFAPDPETKSHEGSTTKRLQVTITGSDLAEPTVISAAADPAATKRNMMYQQETIAFGATGTSVTLELAALLPLDIPAHKPIGRLRCGPVVANLDLEENGGGNPRTPEPGSLGLLGIGASSLLWRRQRR